MWDCKIGGMSILSKFYVKFCVLFFDMFYLFVISFIGDLVEIYVLVLD